METTELKTELVTFLNSKAADWHLEDIKTDEGEGILASALPTGHLATFGRPRLVFRYNGSFLDIHLRQLMTLGNRASNANVLTAAAMQWIVCGEGESGLTSDRVMLVHQMVQRQLTGTWTKNDVIAAITLGTNDITRLTKVVRDSRDGEVYIACTIPISQPSLPACVSDCCGFVLQHGMEVVNCARVVCELLLPAESTPVPCNGDDKEANSTEDSGSSAPANREPEDLAGAIAL